MTSQNWQERSRPVRLEKRYEFESYDALRAFLDDAADLSEQKGLFPDIGFGKTYANFTIHIEEGSSELTDTQREFAKLLDSLKTAQQS
ncbi:MAG: pterin-4-alpha-carbinolamine dehydratase [Gammaproteobacteria bacterium SG8_15]|jgi:4a-hydroxytetrahydrobiopterin dehydratase|nr:MAG: pterin-4-alpha-carbinolamine dehydratase [Gammaproteobacteria bacterium SG8_15]